MNTLMNNKKYKLDERTQQLERLIRRMAGLLKEYQVPEYDYEAKSIIDEVNEVALQ
jgi:hypothetical protein